LSEFPRPLTTKERAVLDFLLSLDFPGARELRDQAEKAVVIGRCGCGCPTVDLTVDERAESAELADRNPVEATAANNEGLQLLLFTRHGRLESLELVWYEDGPPPAEFPALETFAPPRAPG
jgi:hypothetical protein